MSNLLSKTIKCRPGFADNKYSKVLCLIGVMVARWIPNPFVRVQVLGGAPKFTSKTIGKRWTAGCITSRTVRFSTQSIFLDIYKERQINVYGDSGVNSTLVLMTRNNVGALEYGPKGLGVRVSKSLLSLPNFYCGGFN